MELYPYEKNQLMMLEDMYTAIDRYTLNEYPCGYLIHEGKMYLPRGTPSSKLEMWAGVTASFKKRSDPKESMSRKHESFYDPRDFLQEDSIKFLMTSNNHQLALNLGTGKGKAEPVSRKIPTPTKQGWTRMGDLKIGDYVFGQNGRVTKILQVFEQGVKDIFKLTFADGRYALCTENHLWAVRGYKQGRYHPITTKELFDDYRTQLSNFVPNVNTPNRQFFFQRYIPVCEPVEYPHYDVPIDPWVLGVLIGNGCLREVALMVSSGSEEVPTKMAKILNLRSNRNSLKNYSYRFYRKDTGKRVTTKDFLKKLPELADKYSHEKIIPDMYMYNDIETRMELLRGLLDTDGSISFSEGRYNITYSSCSKKLLEQIQEIVRSLGHRTSEIHEDKRVDKYRSGFHGSVSILIPNELKHQFFTISYKHELAKEAALISKRDIYSDLRITKIQLIKQEEARCIMVDNSDHLYLTQDYIVTHNSYVTLASATQLSERILIITHNTGLKKQWIRTATDMFDYKKDELLDISGSEVMESIAKGDIPTADVYFVNHQTLRSYLSQYGGFQLSNFFKKLKIGIKVYDEAHLEFANILLMDYFSNTNRTWYLTATFDRSDKTESKCFQLAFSSLDTFGEKESREHTEKHVIYHAVYFKSRPDPYQMRQINRYGNMTTASYGHWAFLRDPNESAYAIIKTLVDKTKDLEGKTLIFVPLIEAVDLVTKKLKLDFPDKEVGAYHSKVDRDEKESVLKRDIIVSTIKSCGTGRDIPGLRVLICLEPIASKVQTHQMLGRLRKYGTDMSTYFYDCIDISIPPCNWYWKSRMKVIPNLVKSVIYLDLNSG